eukprot:CAMPEP_0206621144 /NCGR_PEP_ID=MMETSP0325_2-20121206/62053_1 /ASSEMBLY_ACC=CAM_ASM_000347 /TAXON_ID=2866 /ORGANISM="Crypthecodinium cohnii, Strain Seligo" /LENGTH=66 /DNA_ID=CAMNT_0054144257 /DNA_START=783 /DNA_END=983 /DNA_ORIENTATION=+
MSGPKPHLSRSGWMSELPKELNLASGKKWNLKPSSGGSSSFNSSIKSGMMKQQMPRSCCEVGQDTG